MATEITPVVEKDYGSLGTIPYYAVKLEGLVGLSAAESETVVNYAESPFNEDMVVVDAYMVITTVDAQDADLDIGIADDATATNAEDNLFDSPANSAAGVLQGTVVTGVVGVARPLWLKNGSATNSFITAQQNGNVNASSLVYNLILIVAPYNAFK